MFEPEVIHARHTVTGAEDDVDRMSIAMHFPQPVGEGELGSISGLPEQLERPRHIVAPNEDVEVLRRTAHAGVPRIGKAAAHQVLETSPVESRQRFDEEVRCRFADYAWTAGVHEDPSVWPAGTSNTRKAGRSGNARNSSGMDTLQTRAPDAVLPSSWPRWAWPCSTSETG